MGLAEYGYVYYPYRCVDGSVPSCKVHMVIPGCRLNFLASGYTLMNDYGYG